MWQTVMMSTRRRRVWQEEAGATTMTKDDIGDVKCQHLLRLATCDWRPQWRDPPRTQTSTSNLATNKRLFGCKSAPSFTTVSYDRETLWCRGSGLQWDALVAYFDVSREQKMCAVDVLLNQFLRPILSCGVYPSVCLSRSCILSRRVIASSNKHFSPSGSQTILVFFVPNVMAIFQWGPPNKGLKCRWVDKNRNSRPIYGFIACCQRCDYQALYTQLRRTVVSWWHSSLVSGVVCYSLKMDDEVFMTSETFLNTWFTTLLSLRFGFEWCGLGISGFVNNTAFLIHKLETTNYNTTSYWLDSNLFNTLCNTW